MMINKSDLFTYISSLQTNESVKTYNLAFPMFISELSPEFHEELEITYIRSGQGEFVLDSKSYSVKKGDIIVISPNIIHSGKALKGKEMFTSTLRIAKNYICPITADYRITKYILPVMCGGARCCAVVSENCQGYTELLYMVEGFLSALQHKEKYYELELSGYVMHSFYVLNKFGYIDNFEKSTTEIKNEALIREAIKYIEENYENHIDVDTLASQCNFSASHFMSMFKKYTGTTCSKFINQYRLLKASHMLLFSNDSVLSIAIGCGFNNISYFNREFKKHFLKTPNEYRKSK